MKDGKDLNIFTEMFEYEMKIRRVYHAQETYLQQGKLKPIWPCWSLARHILYLSVLRNIRYVYFPFFKLAKIYSIAVVILIMFYKVRTLDAL